VLGGESFRVLTYDRRGSRTKYSGRDYRRHWTPVDLDLVVPDVDAATEKAIAAGARLEKQIQTYAWGRMATLSCPFGNGFCLLQWIGGGYDEVA
jgi:uncharacterized glyoxalase superfamily protein PhnB